MEAREIFACDMERVNLYPVVHQILFGRSMKVSDDGEFICIKLLVWTFAFV